MHMPFALLFRLNACLCRHWADEQAAIDRQIEKDNNNKEPLYKAS